MKMKKRTLILRGSIFTLIFAGTVFGSYILTPNRTKKVVQDVKGGDEDEYEITPFSKFVSRISSIFGNGGDESKISLHADINNFDLSWPSETLTRNHVYLNGNVDLIASGLDDLTFTVEVNAKYNDLNLDLGVGYVNEKMYLAVNDTCLKTTMPEVNTMIDKVNTLFFDPENPNGLGINLNLDGLLDQLLGDLDLTSIISGGSGAISIVEEQKEEYNKVSITTPEGSGSLQLDVGMLLDKETNDLLVINLNKLNYGDFSAKGKILCEYDDNKVIYGLDDARYPVQRGEFVEVINYSSWIDKIFTLFDTRKLGLDLSTSIRIKTSEGIKFLTDLDITANLDFSNLFDISHLVIDMDGIDFDSLPTIEDLINKTYFDAHLVAKDENHNLIGNITAALYNNAGYLSINENGEEALLRAKVEIEEVNRIIDTIPSLLESFDTTKSVRAEDVSSVFDAITDSELVNAIKVGNYLEVLDIFESVNVGSDKIKLSINLTSLGFGSNAKLFLTLNNSTSSNPSVIDIKMTNIEIGDVCFDLDLKTNSFSNSTKESVQANIDAGRYIKLDFASDVIQQVTDFVNQPKMAVDLNGYVLDDSEKQLGFTFEGNTQFDANQKVGFGSIKFVSKKENKNTNHTVAIHVDNSGELPENDNMFFVYNNKLKGRFTVKTINDIIDLGSEILSTDDPRFKKFIDPIKATFLTSMVAQAIQNEDYASLLNNTIFKEISRDNVTNELKIVLSKEALDLGNDLVLKIGFANIDGKQELRNVSLSLSFMSKNIYLNLTIKDYDESFVSPVDISNVSSFMNFSDIKVLLDFGITSTKLAVYHLTADVTATVLGFLDAGIQLDFYIEVNGETTKVYGQARPESFVGQIGRIAHTVITEFVFEPNTSADDKIGGRIHLFRTDIGNLSGSVKDRYYWVTNTSNFIDNIIDYLCADFLTLDSIVLKEIKKAADKPQQDQDPKYEDMFVKPFTYTHTSTTDKWSTTLSMTALTGNSKLGNLKLDLFGKSINGENYFSQADIEMDLVSVVNLTGSIYLKDINPSLTNWNSIQISNPNKKSTSDKMNLIERYNYILGIYSGWNETTKNTYFNNPTKAYTSF